MVKKCVRFSDNVQIEDTYSKYDYNRQASENVYYQRVTGKLDDNDLAILQKELWAFINLEMPVHSESIIYGALKKSKNID